MRLILTFWGFVVLVGCGQAQQTSDDKIYDQVVDTLTSLEIESLLLIPIRQDFRAKYSGKYSYKMTPKGDKVLNGEFSFSFLDSSKYVDSSTGKVIEGLNPLRKIRYQGQFEDNKKTGKFVEEYLSSDDVDWYSEWKIVIDFDKDKCKSATFDGLIGTSMPTRNYKFATLDTCSFERVEHLAWKLWTKEYEKQKNTH